MEKSRNESSVAADSKQRMDEDSDKELDEILGHSAADREEEEAAERERAKAMPRRLSASQEEDIVKIADMQQQLAKDGVKEDRAENEILQPSEEKEMQRLPVDPVVLAAATSKRPSDNHMDVDCLKAAGEASDADGVHLPHITLPVLAQPHARLSGHPAHVATPRGSVSAHSFLPATDESGAEGGGGNAPMDVEVEENSHDSRSTDAAETAASDASESMLTEDDLPTATVDAASEDGSAVQADNNGLHEAGENGTGEAGDEGATKPIVDSTFVHQNGVEKHAEELQS